MSWCPLPESEASAPAQPKRAAGPIRICVLDDHPIVHDGLRYLASQMQDIEFCGGALNGRELDTLLRAVTPDILRKFVRALPQDQGKISQHSNPGR
jgi:hypothetical protein